MGRNKQFSEYHNGAGLLAFVKAQSPPLPLPYTLCRDTTDIKRRLDGMK